MQNGTKVQVFKNKDALVSRVEDETSASELHITCESITGWVQKKNRPDEQIMEVAHLTLNHMKVMLEHDAIQVLASEFQQPQERERYLAALQTALELLEANGVTVDRRDGIDEKSVNDSGLSDPRGQRGPMGPWFAPNEKEMVEHLLESLRGYRTGKEAHRDSDGNCWYGLEFWELVSLEETLLHYRKLLTQPTEVEETAHNNPIKQKGKQI